MSRISSNSSVFDFLDILHFWSSELAISFVAYIVSHRYVCRMTRFIFTQVISVAGLVLNHIIFL